MFGFVVFQFGVDGVSEVWVVDVFWIVGVEIFDFVFEGVNVFCECVFEFEVGVVCSDDDF